ncbi:MAG: hypothetical protein ACLPPV_21255 [Candidatus Korobacteraceae bacterium]
MRATSIVIRFAMFAWLVTGCWFVFGQAKPILVGVLEDNPGHFSGEPHYRAVRAVFYKEGEQWKAFPSSDCTDQDCLQKYPQEVIWTITFDGRQLGNVTGRTPEEFDFYSSVGQQVIISKDIPPAVGQPSREFGGFLGQPVYRPLIAVSQPNYRDPDGWKPAKLSAGATLAVRREFRKRFAKVTNCPKGRSDKVEPWPYEDSNISVQKAYASQRGWMVASVLLAPYRCDGPPDELFAMQWFVITPQQEVRWLDSNMWLVDAGDYDHDGKSELVFVIDDYNRGGYRLFYDDFRQRAVFEFSYH